MGLRELEWRIPREGEPNVDESMRGGSGRKVQCLDRFEVDESQRLFCFGDWIPLEPLLEVSFLFLLASLTCEEEGVNYGLLSTVERQWMYQDPVQGWLMDTP